VKAPPLPPGGYRHCASSRLYSSSLVRLAVTPSELPLAFPLPPSETPFTKFVQKDVMTNSYLATVFPAYVSIDQQSRPPPHSSVHRISRRQSLHYDYRIKAGRRVATLIGDATFVVEEIACVTFPQELVRSDSTNRVFAARRGSVRWPAGPDGARS